MVVVVLVAVLAMIAAPAMSAAREDRLAFESANSIGRVFHEARTRAMARGAAHLVAASSNGTTDRGTFVVFEALDGAGHPVSSCRDVDEWADVPAGGGATNVKVDGVSLNGSASSLQVEAGLLTAIADDGGTKIAFGVLCFTPSGAAYAASGDSFKTAVAALSTQQPFVGHIIVSVSRKPAGATTTIGMVRNVIVTSSGSTRIRSI